MVGSIAPANTTPNFAPVDGNKVADEKKKAEEANKAAPAEVAAAPAAAGSVVAPSIQEVAAKA